MENASKALLMAGVILIALLVIGALMSMFNQLTSYQIGKSGMEVVDSIAEYNQGFTRFADFFFDGLFMDWMVADQISQSQKQVALTTLQIEEAIERLEKLQAKAEKDKEHLQKQLEELVVRS